MAAARDKYRVAQLVVCLEGLEGIEGRLGPLVESRFLSLPCRVSAKSNGEDDQSRFSPQSSAPVSAKLQIRQARQVLAFRISFAHQLAWWPPQAPPSLYVCNNQQLHDCSFQAAVKPHAPLELSEHAPLPRRLQWQQNHTTLTTLTTLWLQRHLFH